MSPLHAVNSTATPTQPARAGSPSTVKTPLTPNRRRRVVENDEYAAFLRRVVRAYARRVAQGDVEALALMLGLSAEIDTAIAQAVTGLRDLRLLLGRDRLPARHHPPGRPATLGPRILTAATPALSPEPAPGSGPGATADDDFGTPGTPAHHGRRMLPPHPASAAGSTPST